MSSLSVMPHGFAFPDGLPDCQICGQPPASGAHVNTYAPADLANPAFMAGMGFSGAVGSGRRLASDKLSHAKIQRAHPYTQVAAIAKNVGCVDCGQPMAAAVHRPGMPVKAASSLAMRARSAATLTDRDMLMQALGIISAIDNIVDEAQESLADYLGIPNPDADDEDKVESQQAFVTELGGKVVLAAQGSVFDRPSALPREMAADWERAAKSNPHFMWVSGRFVEADRPNRNKALWSTEDLELGQPTVAHGPLNWLHEERHIIGTIADAKMVRRQAARDFNTDARKRMAKSGDAMPDGSFPIANVTDLRNAIHLVGRSKNPAAAKSFIIKRARELNLESELPSSWRQTAAMDSAGSVGNHIVAMGPVWKFIYPWESGVISDASQQNRLWFSMECVSREVACTECSASLPYDCYMREVASRCSHIRAGGPRRFVDPQFLGGAVIVPPVKPGWAAANVQVMRAASSLIERQAAAFTGVADADAESVVGQLLTMYRTEEV